MITHDTKADKSSLEPKTAVKSNRKRTVILMIVAVILCSLYLRSVWSKYSLEIAEDATLLARSVESMLPRDALAALAGGPEDLEKPEYRIIKQSLTRLAERERLIRFAYLLGERDGNMILLLDSEPPDSPDYSPPGQVYDEANESDWVPFRRGTSILTQPSTDRWGTWISALEPIKNTVDGHVLAVFGIDYDAAAWYSRIWHHMIPDIALVLCIIILALALLFILEQRGRLTRLNKRLARDEMLYRSVFEQAPIGIAIVDDKAHINQSEYGDTAINRMYERITGWRKEDLLDLTWPEITHPNDLREDLDKFARFQRGDIDGYTMEKRYLRPDGSSIWTNMKISPLLESGDERALHICILEDISARKNVENLLRESERNKSSLLSHLPGMAYRCANDANWTMHYVSTGCLALTGYPSDSLVDNKDLAYNDLITPKYRDMLRQQWKRVLKDRLSFMEEYEITTAQGEQKWVLELGEGVFDDNGNVEALEGIVIDISNRRVLENTLLYSSEHDRSTGLYNRFFLEKKIEADMQRGLPQRSALVGLNFGATDALSRVHGHNYAQALMKQIADILLLGCPNRYLLCSTFWNQFVFYIKDHKDMDELLAFCHCIAESLETTLKTERIYCGIGILEIQQTTKDDANLLLKKLLIASERVMEDAETRTSIIIYNVDMETEILRAQEIIDELSLIAESKTNEGLFLQYQPILDVRKDQVCGFEALARVNNRKLGLISPMEFIPLAEKTKLILPLGQKILLEALRFVSKLGKMGYDTLVINVNISEIQLFSGGFVERFLQTISDMQVNPNNVAIELTESIFNAEYERINNILNTLRQAGVQIFLDDFGTGSSSLARERELNIDCLKIDKHFIDKLMEIDLTKAITGDIISMAHKMGHCVVAEGVEWDVQKQYLIANGCDKIQGFLVSKPLHEQEALELLNNQSEK